MAELFNAHSLVNWAGVVGLSLCWPCVCHQGCVSMPVGTSGCTDLFTF